MAGILSRAIKPDQNLTFPSRRREGLGVGASKASFCIGRLENT